jgi:hypothetical protein
MMISPLFSPTWYDSTFGTYSFLRNCLFKDLAFAGPTNASEMSQPGNTFLATSVNGTPVTLEV